MNDETKISDLYQNIIQEMPQNYTITENDVDFDNPTENKDI